MARLEPARTARHDDDATNDDVVKPKWRKALYVRQPYSDNYVDSTFMTGLIQNGNSNRAAGVERS